ncbi:MAG: amino acid ABC transporter permease, partial [Christensenellaceae bacterium]|nr:amino acid ABC transporter permease [Christensenellaceae bacterium]
MWNNFGQQLYDNIIHHDRWLSYLEGMGNTLILTVGAAILGIIIGSLVAIVKVYAIDNKKLKFIDAICDIYLTVVRGTPMMVQVMIMVFVVGASASLGASLWLAMLALGINSGAYVAEVVRAGIMAVDKGQTEAGRSLGLSKNTTMKLIVLPQAIKNILPALGNELITLFKETSIVGYVAVADLTFKAMEIRTRSLSAVPLLVIAALYLIVVMLLTWGLRIMERRLSK